jgi:hypothetical protein
MPNEVKWIGPTSRSTGIAAGSLTAGANLLSSEIDNETNLDRWMGLKLTWTCSTASTAGEVVEVYLVLDLTSAEYEDGGTTGVPYKSPIGVFVDDGGTAAQIQAFSGIPIPPFAFKILIKSELGQNATSVTLLAETYNEEIQ